MNRSAKGDQPRASEQQGTGGYMGRGGEHGPRCPNDGAPQEDLQHNQAGNRDRWSHESWIVAMTLPDADHQPCQGACHREGEESMSEMDGYRGAVEGRDETAEGKWEIGNGKSRSRVAHRRSQNELEIHGGSGGGGAPYPG